MSFWARQIGKGALLKVNKKMGKEEAEAREQLALCYRVAHHELLNEGCDNHFSIMLTVDGYEALLTLPHGILWSQTRPEDFILCDFEGQILRPSGRKDKHMFSPVYVPDLSAIKIHGKLHAGLGAGRAKAVFHTHQPYTSALGAAKVGEDELRQVHQNSCRFYNSVLNYREFNGVVNNDEEGVHLTEEFLKKGNETKRVMVMRNHGIMTVGPTAAQALMDLYFFEKCARVQVEMMQMGQNLDDCVIDDDVAAETHKYIFRERERMSMGLFNAWANAGI